MTGDQVKEVHDDFVKGKNESFEPSILSRYRVDFSPTEKKVFMLAKELMKKHYILDTEKLYLQSNKEMKDETPNTVRVAIKGLISKRVLFDGAAMTRDDVLSNETRHRMFEIICTRPGIHISAIRTILDKDSRTILFDLNVLARFGFVRCVSINNNKIYFESSFPNENDVLYYYMQKDKARDIVIAILENPSVSLDDLGTIFSNSMSLKTLSRKIQILLENKLLTAKYEINKIIALNIMPGYRNKIKAIFST